MTKLKFLRLDKGSLGSTSTDKFIALLQSHKCNLFQRLEGLELNSCFSDALDAERFFRAVSKNNTFENVKTLSIYEDLWARRHIKLDFLGPAFSGGTSAGLRYLHLDSLDGCGDGLR